VGEQFTNTSNFYNLIVDNNGIAVNTNYTTKSNVGDEYAFYVDGNMKSTGIIAGKQVIIDGVPLTNTTTVAPVYIYASNIYDSNIWASNVVPSLSNMITNIISSSIGSAAADASFWSLSTGESQNIYYPGKVTIGNNLAGQLNSYALNIQNATDLTIDHAHLNIQNTQLAQFRVSIIGADPASPAIVNTCPGVPIEFHASRNQGYFSSVYRQSYYNNNGIWLCNVPTQVPIYTTVGQSPHMAVDVNGNVGIHTSTSIPINFYQRRRIGNSESAIVLSSIAERPALYVDGSVFASNIVIYDADRNAPANIDDIYVRRLGVSLLANQIIPGPFADGYFQFTSNMSIMGATEEKYALTVYGDAHITRRLQVDCNINTYLSTTDELIVRNYAGFCNDVIAGRDLIVTDSLRLKGGIWTEYTTPLGCNSWCQIQFQVAGAALSNINYIGQGITTPGRLGVGINPNLDAVNSQMVVTKRSSDIFELELRDLADPFMKKVGYIGHRKSTIFPNDGSLIIATPYPLDVNYNFGYTAPKQNIYFYPAADFSPTAPEILTSNSPPTLGICADRRVGINTYEPSANLHVEGSVYISSNIAIADPYSGQRVTMGIWKIINTNTLVYNDPSAPYVGVNTLADKRYGMNVSGGIKADGYYTPKNQLIAPFLSSSSNALAIALRPDQTGDIIGAFTYNNIGIGVGSPMYPLDIKNIYPPSVNPTFDKTTALNIRSSDYSRTIGMTINGWATQVNDAGISRQELFLFSKSNVAERAVWSQYSPITNKYQTVIGAPVDALVSPTYNHPDQTAALTVGGNLAVLGNVNITGKYMVKGAMYVNCNLVSDPVVLEVDDVFIGGNDIYLRPGPATVADTFWNKVVTVGYTTARRFLERPETSVFRVYQEDSASPSIAKFSSACPNGLIDISSTTNTLRFGIYEGRFSFLDESYLSYMSFNKSADGSERYVGYNITSPTAQVHLQTIGTGTNMIRLSKLIDGDNGGVAPEIEFEKVTIDNFAPATKWTVHGPDSSYNQKLSLLYTGSNDTTYDERKELFTFSSTGCVGVGNTQPEYGLDIRGTGTSATLRIHSTDGGGSNAPSPQLVFLSGCNLFGVDDYTDYRFYAHDKIFKIDQQSSSGNIQSVLYFSKEGRVGVNTDVTETYTMTVGGTINITDKLYLKGVEMFAIGTSVKDETIKGLSITLLPSTKNPGSRGIVINNETLKPSDLFHMYSGEDANFITFDSIFTEANVNFRNKTSQVWRTGMDNNEFYYEYNPYLGNLGINGSEHADFTRGFRLTALDTATTEYNLAIPGHLSLSTTATAAYIPSIHLSHYGTLAAADISFNTSGLTLVSSSNIGLGTTAPVAAVHVYNKTLTANKARVFQITTSNADAAIMVTADGYVGLGTTSPTTPFTVNVPSLFVPQANFTSNVYFGANTDTFGNAYVHGNTVTDSDRRLKTNLKVIDNALERVCALSGYTYNLVETGEEALGLVAQEVQEQFPELVKNHNGILGVSYGNMVAVLVEAIKTLHKNATKAAAVY